MSIPFWCVFISALLIYVARMPVTKAMKEQGGYNNHLPRQRPCSGGASKQLRGVHIVCGGGVDGAHHADGGVADRFAGHHLCDFPNHLFTVLLGGSCLAAQPGMDRRTSVFVAVDD